MLSKKAEKADVSLKFLSVFLCAAPSSHSNHPPPVQIFLQVALISVCSSVCSFCIVYMCIFPESYTPAIGVRFQFLFLECGGIQPLIYLAMNQRIRSDVVGMARWLICPKSSAPIQPDSTVGVKTVDSSKREPKESAEGTKKEQEESAETTKTTQHRDRVITTPCHRPLPAVV
jgi:hypothetical protein